MSAPSIPNLFGTPSRGGGTQGDRGGSSLSGLGLGLGRGRGRTRVRGGGGAGAGAGSSSGFGSTSAQAHDVTIQGTDTDAAVSRLSAVEVGYLEDPFARLFVQGPAGRRLPIINRGTYTRTTAINQIVDRFLAQTANSGGADDDSIPQTRQIVSLGAGTDTRSLRLFSSSTPHSRIAYHEIDFPAITERKQRIVRASPQLRSILSDPVSVPAEEGTETTWRSQARNNCELFCHGLDLRALAQQPDGQDSTTATASSSSSPGVTLKGLRTDVPTLLISECCLCYLDPADASAVIRWFESRIPDLGVVIYEPVKPDDPFGRMMVSNLAARRIHMPTLDVYRLPADQERRLAEAGFGQVRHMTIDKIWGRWVPHEEKARLDRLEGLDEVEEWGLLAGHYIVAWAWRSDKFQLPDGS
ncbi:S-adenosyl-L-methionine-dependent methyltransferase [Podospora appendiculata]|uniref:Leucine carboxyl methyltransferase 1 n=1 Tax=Podospora appendiculata TaxID=314037 RepID=A0AAE0X991_9PEZI|nr:S-adenosyl-L-methionine-dependent methyltransferase [Podospora appendiculata]